MKIKYLVHDRTTVYNIGYHIVWSVKYRKKTLTRYIEKFLKNILYKIAEDIINNIEIIFPNTEMLSNQFIN